MTTICLHLFCLVNILYLQLVLKYIWRQSFVNAILMPDWKMVWKGVNRNPFCRRLNLMFIFHVISHVFYKIFHVKICICTCFNHFIGETNIEITLYLYPFLKSLLGFTSNLSNDHLFALWQKCLLHIWKRRNMITLLYVFLFVQ